MAASPARARQIAEKVGSEFTKMYYNVLRSFPTHLPVFYKDNSKISRTGLDGKMRVFTFPDVDEKDLNMPSSSGFDSFEVTRVMSQDSRGGGVLVAVDGYFTSNVRSVKNSKQNFFLAPQGTGYFVLTDMFQFHDVSEANATIHPADYAIEETFPETEQVCEPNHGFQNVSKLSYASVVKKIRTAQGQRSSSCDLYQDEDSRKGNSQKSHAVADAGKRALVASPTLLDGHRLYVEKKRPYHVIIHMKNLPPDATIALVEDAFKQFGEIRRGGTRLKYKTSFSYGFVEFKEKNAAQKAIEASPVIIGLRRVYVERMRADYISQHSSSCDTGDDTGNGNSQESKAVTEGAGICVKGLPPNATIALLEDVFKQFGPIKKGGIQVRQPHFNYWLGLVEFEKADSAERAIKLIPGSYNCTTLTMLAGMNLIQASPLRINGHRASVEKKRPSPLHINWHTAYLEKKRPSPLRIDGHTASVEKKQPSPLRIDGHTAYVEKKRPYYKESGYGESPSAEPRNINRGEEVGGSLGNNPFWNWQKMMGEVRLTNVWQKLMMGSRAPEVYYDIRNWEKIMEEEQMKFKEEQGRQHNQNRYRSEELRGTEGVGLDLEEEAKEENQTEEQRMKDDMYNQNRYEQMKETLTGVVDQILEDEGRQYNQNRYEKIKETLTGGVGQILGEDQN